MLLQACSPQFSPDLPSHMFPLLVPLSLPACLSPSGNWEHALAARGRWYLPHQGGLRALLGELRPPEVLVVHCAQAAESLSSWLQKREPGVAGSLPASEDSSPPPLSHRHTFTHLSTDGTQVSLGSCCPSFPGTGKSGAWERLVDGGW